jgi:TolB-like protein/DNA-binding winged helix-turn-helix (wHTH) protein/Tfp pilus assembly protein PilF
MPVTMPTQRTLRFGAFELNVARGELRKSGIAVRLRPQAAKILTLLASQPGEIIRRDQLREEIWGHHVFVDFEHGLNLCIREIRAALDDDADKPRYVETLPRIGYRFIAHVEEIDPQAPWTALRPVSEQNSGPNRAAAPKKLPSRRWAVAGAITLTLAVLAMIIPLGIRGLRGRLLPRTSSVRIESLAVLPLENLSGDPEQQYFADGMTDELITELAKIHSLRVISRNSVMQYKAGGKPLSQIARELNVDAVVEGTVMRSGDRVRITAQLIAAPQDRHLWAESYERDLHDVLQLQDAVARDIATHVQVRLTPTEQAHLAQARPVNPRAYELLLKGRYEWAKRGSQGLTQGLDYFQQSARLDPDFAPAYVGIAESYGLLGNSEIVPIGQVYSHAKSAALKALELDPDLSEAHAALAEVLNDYEWDWAEAGKEYKRAIELDPNNANAHHWYAMSLIWVGRTGEAIAEIERASQLDPAGVHINANVGLIFLWARQYDRAVVQAQKTLKLEPNDATSLLVLAQVNLKKGNYQAAINGFKTLTKTPGASAPRSQAWLAWAYALASQKGESLGILGKLKQLCRHEYCPPTSIAMIYGALGHKDAAFAWLDKALREGDGIQLLSIKVNLYFDPLRSDPRFADVLRRIGLPQ